MEVGKATIQSLIKLLENLSVIDFLSKEVDDGSWGYPTI